MKTTDHVNDSGSLAGNGSPEQAAPQPLELSKIEIQQPDTRNQSRRAPRGKIGRLAKITRDKLNSMLRDGIEYANIIAALGEELKGVTPRNISNWHTSPSYQHWLLHQEWLEDLRAEQESAFDILRDFDAAKFNQGALQLAVTRLFLALRHLETVNLNDKLGGNARTFSSLVHALARACRETIVTEKHRDATAKAAAAELKKLDPNRDLSDPEFDLLVKKMDQVFKVARKKPAASSSSALHSPGDGGSPPSGEAAPVTDGWPVAPKQSEGGSSKLQAGPSKPESNS